MIYNLLSAADPALLYWYKSPALMGLFICRLMRGVDVVNCRVLRSLRHMFMLSSVEIFLVVSGKITVQPKVYFPTKRHT